MRYLRLLGLLLLSLSFRAQITIIGHNMINDVPLKQTRIVVLRGSVVSETLHTQGKTDFRLQLDFGHVYRVYFENDRSPRMYLEIAGDNVPVDKYEYRMTYEMNVPFVDRYDEDVDTTVFRKPFHRVIFNGRSKMVDDTSYNNAFARNILKKPEERIPPKDMAPASLPSIVAGRVYLSGKTRLPIANRPISVIGHNGGVIKSTTTNRSGGFVFTNVHISDASKIRMELQETDGFAGLVSLASTSQSLVSETRAVNRACEWALQKSQFFQLVDNNYSSNIGGKLVSASPREKKFYADKTVYLSNKLNTVVKQTKTSKLGTFVFEDIKPDHHYLLGINENEIDQGAKVDLLNKDDRYVGTLDSLAGIRSSLRLHADQNDQRFNELTIAEDDMKMDVKGTIYGDNVNNPIGKLKIVLLNDQYQVIDSAITSDYGTFKFKYLPFLKRFYLSAENSDNILDVFKNILIYSSDDNLIKIMTHQKGTRFRYQPVATEITHLRDIEIADPWLDLLEPGEPELTAAVSGTTLPAEKTIAENILFETARYDITDASKEILDKIILVMNTNRSLKIEIGAHTDSKGSAASNLRLSEMRAKTVKDYITAAGIGQLRITTRGFGESRLLNDCGDAAPCSEVEHAQNRRIEFRILGEQD